MLVYPFEVPKTVLGCAENELREIQTPKMQVSYDTTNLAKAVAPWEFRSKASEVEKSCVVSESDVHSIKEYFNRAEILFEFLVVL